MGGDGINDSVEAGEGVSRMVNGVGHTSGSIASSEACGGDSSVGAETCVDNELEVRGFSEGDRWRFGKKVQSYCTM